MPELAPLLGSVAEARRRRAASIAAENEAVASAVHELVDKLHVSQGDAGRLLGMTPSEVARFTPPRASPPTGPRELTPVPAPGPLRPATAPALRPRPRPAQLPQRAAPARRPSWAEPPDDTERRA